jgi:alginate O-acetyltransferase complex protein AlgI
VLFNSFVFLFGFLPITYVVFWLLRNAESRYIWLTITGYVFYGYWDPRFTLLMAFSTVVSYSAGLGFLRWSDPRRRKLCLIVPIVTDLALLGFFKYTNFLIGTFADVAEALGHHPTLPHLDIILPVGISFYTFHTISYIVDSYRGVVRPTRNFFEFSAYVSLFSQLVAGPIVRFRQIEQDLAGLGHADRERWLARGISFFTIGLLEKVVIADALATAVDPALAGYRTLSTAGTWLAMSGYALQLYFDFCGYSDMAVGLGYLFGLRIPQNFNSPYKSVDPSDFWRRWHISLSSCLRDYVYIPLGGNRYGELRTYRNLVLTMLIGGLWHGAAWNFVVWGGYHGALLASYRKFGDSWDVLPVGVRRSAMVVLAIVGWVFFRSTDMHMAGALLSRMFSPTSGIMPAHALEFCTLVLISGAWAVAGPNAFDVHHEGWVYRPRYGFPIAAAFGMSLAMMLGSGSSPFLYFQF